MSDFGDGPRFPGELSEHLTGGAPDPPDRWRDRLRHAWPIYAVLAVMVPFGLLAVAAPVYFFGKKGIVASVFVAMLPLAVYARVLQWRLMSGRDVNTGEDWGPRKE